MARRITERYGREPVIARHAAGGAAWLALPGLAEQPVDIEAHATLKDLVD